MTRLVLTLALAFRILFPISTLAQDTGSCGAHPEDPDATIAACTPVIKQIKHHLSQCHDEMVWAASTRESGPLAITPSLPATMSNECSGYVPPYPLYAHHTNAERLSESHRNPNAAPGYEPPPDPDLGQALYSRAEAYLAKHKFDPAIDDYDAAAKLNNQNATLLYHRALAYHGLNNDSHAVDDFTASIKLNGSNSAVWADRCRSRAILGKFPQAITDCDTSLELLAANPAAYKARGLVNLRRRQYTLAIADYDAAIKLSQPTAVSLYGRGLAKRASGDAAGAAADTSAALQLNPAVAAIFKRYRIRLK